MPIGPSGSLPPFKLNSANLYEAFCNHLKDDQSTLLLYLLLHQNINFRNYVLSRTNIDTLVCSCNVLFGCASFKMCEFFIFSVIDIRAKELEVAPS